MRKSKSKKKAPVEERMLSREGSRKALQELTLMDDGCMRIVVQQNIELVQFILRKILEDPSVDLLTVEGQKTFISSYGKKVTLDIFAVGRGGANFNIEVQNDSRGATMARAAAHLCMMGSQMILVGDKYPTIPAPLYVIFITKEDVHGKGQAKYQFEFFDDMNSGGHVCDLHIIYVNGAYEGDDPLVELIQDMRCADPADMNYDEFREAMSFVKDDEEGRQMMYGVLGDLQQKAAHDARVECAEAMLARGVDQDIVSEDCKLPKEEVAELARALAERHDEAAG